MTIRLFDIPSKLPLKAWSPNVWKTRYVLNYKNLPYETTWVEYPDIPSACLEIGASPTTRRGKYTFPVIQDKTTGAVVSDSWNIVEYLESIYPPSDPELRLIPPGTRGLQQAFLFAFSRQLRSLWPIAIPQEVKIFNPRSEEYFRSTRAEWLKPENLGEESVTGHWNQLEKDLGVVDSWIRKDDVFIMGGEQPTYPDLAMSALMIWCRTLWGKESPEWGDRLARWHNGRWGRLVEKLEEYEKIV